MGRLTRQEKAAAIGGGLLLGAIIGLAGSLMRLPLAADIALCVIAAAGVGAFLASGKYGQR